MKKILFFMLGVLMALPGIARDFTYEYEGQTLRYTVLDEDAKTCQPMNRGNNSVSGALVIPSVAKDGDIEYSVTEIGTYAFRGVSGLTSVTIPNSVTKIDQYAFYECTGLTSVEIPNSVTLISKSVFSRCSSLTSVSIPESVTQMSASAFDECTALETVFFNAENCTFWISYPDKDGFPTSVKKVVFGEKVRTIPAGLFKLCAKIESLEIPHSVTTIGEEAFMKCTGIKSLTVGRSVSEVGSHAFSYVSPETLTLYSDNAGELYSTLSLSQLKTAVLGDNITSLPYRAFYGCSNLESITMSPAVNSIGAEAFYNCSSLPSFKIPESVTAINDKTFYGCSNLASITIPEAVTSIGAQAFYNCSSLASIKIPESVTAINYNTFYGCSSLASITIPKAVASIEDGAFAGCTNLATLYYNAENCADIPTGALPNFTNLIIGNSVKRIPSYAFRYRTKLTALNIPASVTSIGNSAFDGCSGLKSVIIPPSVAEIGSDIFNGCNGIARGAYPAVIGNPFPANAYAFAYSPEDVRYEDFSLYNPDKTEILFAPWATGEYTLPETIASIADNAFRNCTGIGSAVFPASLTNIGKDAFAGCTGIESLTSYASPAPVFDTSAFTGLYDTAVLNIPENILGDYTNGLNGWTLFKSLKAMNAGPSATFETDLFAYRNIAGSETDVEIVASDKYAALTELAVPSTLQITITPDVDPENPEAEPEPQVITYNVVSIAPNAFAGLENLTSVTVSEGIRNVGSMAFKDCKSLTNVEFPATVTEISSSTFQNCEKLSKFTSNAEITRIGAAAFANTALTAVSLPSVSAIDEFAYADITVLQTLSTGDNLKSIGRNAFVNSGLKKLTLDSPALAEIGEGAFSSNASLTDVNISSNASAKIGNGAFASDAALATVKIGDGVALVGNSAFEECSQIKTLEIGKDVTAIGDKAFSGAIATSGKITFVKDGALRRIGDSAFYQLRVRGELSLPDNVEYIGNNAFAYPRLLTKIVLPDNRNLVICDNAFTHAQRVTEVVFPATIKSIGKHAFADLQAQGMTELNIKADEIGEEAFATESTETYITKVSVAGNGTLGKGAFKGLAALTDASVDIPVIAESAFDGLGKLANVSFSNNLEKIGPYAFRNCAIENLEFPTADTPEAVTVIENGAFSGNTLKNLSLGNRMKSVNFAGATVGQWPSAAVNIVDLGTTVQTIESGTLRPRSLTLPPSLESINSEINTDSLNILASSKVIEIKKPVTVNHVFIDRKYKLNELTRPYFARYCSNNEYSRIPVASLTCGETKNAGIVISKNDFLWPGNYNNTIENIHLGASVKEAYYLTAEYRLSFSEGIETISQIGLSNHSKQTELQLPGSVKRIYQLECPTVNKLMLADSSEALALNDGNISAPLKEVYVGRDLTGTFTFTPWASTLEKAVIGDMATTVKESLFKDCAALTNVIMSDNVTAIGSGAFSGCSGLKVLSLSEKVTDIGDNAYSGCTGLSRIVARGLVPAVGNAGFGTEVEDNVPLYVHDEVIDDYMDSDLFYPFNIEGFNGTIVKEVTTEEELPQTYEPGETFTIPELLNITMELYGGAEEPEEPVMSRRKARRAAAADTDLAKSLYYFSPDPDILSVDQTGTVTVKKKGEGRIWAYVLDGSDRKLEIGVNQFELEDFNRDGVIDSADVQILVNHVVSPADSKLPAKSADLTKDGNIDSNDVQYHVNKAVNKK